MRILMYASDASLPVVLAYLPDSWEVVECRDLDEACASTSGAAVALVEQGTTERGLDAADTLWERGVKLPCLVIGDAPGPEGSRPQVLVRPFTLQDLTRAIEQAASFGPLTQPLKGEEASRAEPPSQVVDVAPTDESVAHGATVAGGGLADAPPPEGAAEASPAPHNGVAASKEGEKEVETPPESLTEVLPPAQEPQEEKKVDVGASPADPGARPAPVNDRGVTSKKPPKDAPRSPSEPERVPKTFAFPGKKAASPTAAAAVPAPVVPAPAATPDVPAPAATSAGAAPAPVVAAPAPVAPDDAEDLWAAPSPTLDPKPQAAPPDREFRRVTVRRTGERIGLGRLVGRRQAATRPAPQDAPAKSPLLERIRSMVNAGRQLETLLDEMPALGNARSIAHAFLEEVIDLLTPDVAAVYVPRSDGMYGVLAGHGLTKTEYGMKVPADQSLFIEVSNGLHGVLVAPVDLAQGLVAGIGGARTEALIAAPLAVGDQCFAIMIVGRDDFSEVDLQRATDLASDAAPGIALAQLIERLGSR